MAKKFTELGFRFVATEGTLKVLEANNIPVQKVKKISEGVPNILDMIRSGLIDLVINTPTKANDATRDGFRIRRAAIEASVTVLTSLDTAKGMLDIVASGLEQNKTDIYNLGLEE